MSDEQKAGAGVKDADQPPKADASKNPSAKSLAEEATIYVALADAEEKEDSDDHGHSHDHHQWSQRRSRNQTRQWTGLRYGPEYCVHHRQRLVQRQRS